MVFFNENSHHNMKQLIIQSVLSIPGVAEIPKLKDENTSIEIIKQNQKWLINIKIICFPYVNIWSVMRQVQIKASYVIEKLVQHQNTVEVNVNVFDIIEENN